MTPRDSSMERVYHRVPVLVIGGTGFIGRWVVRALIDAGAAVVVAARDEVRASRAFEGMATQPTVVRADLSQKGASTDVIRTIAPAVVFNLAVYGVSRTERDAEIMHVINVVVVQELCDALEARNESGWTGRRLIQAGSALEYGEIGGDLAEESVPHPTTDYGRTKLAATQLVEDAATRGLEAIVARLFTVYGSGESAGRLLPSLFEAARSGAALPLSAGVQRRDFTYVEDVAEGLLRLGAVTTSSDVTVNLASGRLTSVREFVETAARTLSLSPDQLQFGAIPTRAEEMWHDAVAIERLRRMTSWMPETTVAEGIRRSWEWEHAH